MKQWLALLLIASGCATTSQATSPSVDACNLTTETACVAYGAHAVPSATRPSAQLVVGLADRAAALPDEDAVDYWYRIVEIVSASDQATEVVNRSAAPSFARIAQFAVDDVGSEASSIEESLSQSQAAVERVRTLAEFAVRWGGPVDQAIAARAIADAYARQADTLAAFELPSELTMTGRATLGEKRDAIVRELRAEARLLADGVAEHCRRHQLEIDVCRDR